MSETERHLGEVEKEGASLQELKKTVSTRIRAAESMQKNTEAALKMAERQVREVVDDLQASQDANVHLKIEVQDLKVEFLAVQAAAKKANEDRQSYYD